MKIAVDLRAVTFGEMGGLTQWLKGSLEQLIRSDTENEYLIFSLPYNYHLVDIQAPNVRRFSLSAAYHARQLTDHLDFAGGVDVLIRGGSADINEDVPIHRQILCVSDLLHEQFPEHYAPDVLRQRRRALHYHQGMGGAIAVPTQALRQQLLACPWTSCPDLFLMPAAPTLTEPEIPETVAEASAILPDAPYFLYPANLYPHKNHRAVLEAFGRFHERQPDVHFVFTGYPYGWEQIFREFDRLPISHLGYLSPRVLAAVYRRALALVYLSRSEELGLPLLETFAAGVPALCSDLAALREVGGDAVLLADPADPDGMADAMLRVAGDDLLRRRLIDRGRRQLEGRTWQQPADALLAAIGRVARRQAPGSITAGEALPLVSVVTPSYNQGRFIRETIESVLGQDYPHIEFRVMDGGSTDETLDVLRSYGERFPWISEKDRGQTHAINKGLALAKGQIRTYLNSDDILRPGAVSRVVDHFRRRPACDLVYGRDAYIDTAGRFIGWFSTTEYSFESLVENCCISQPAAFWRDRIANLAGPFDESLFAIMDYEYWMRLDRAGAVVEYLPELLASTRMHPDAKTSGGADYLHRRFREIYTRSMKHANLLSDTNFHDYLERGIYATWPVLRRFPKATAEAVKTWYYYRHGANCRRFGAAARTLERVALSLLGVKEFSLISFIRDKFRDRKADNIPCPPTVRWGPWVHNLLPARVVAAAALDRGTDELRLSGRPACDSTLSMKLDGETLAEVQLLAGELADLRVPYAQVKGDPRLITLEFSGSVRCPVRGEYAFELHGTNLYGERHYG